MSTLDFKRLRYFVAVFEEGSFSRAAAREHIVQPALSVQVRMLEDEFDVRLFERTPQGIIPTAAGRRLYHLSTELLSSLRHAHQQMKDLGGHLSGQIRIGVMPSVCRGPLAGVISRFGVNHPQVDLQVVEAYSGMLADRLTTGELDVAVCNRPTAQSLLQHRLLLRDRLVLVTRRGAAPRSPAGIDLGLIDPLNLALPSTDHSLRRALDVHLLSGAIRAARTLSIDGLSATFRLVETGDWATLLPSCALINDINSEQLQIEPIRAPDLFSDICELTRPDGLVPVAAQFFVQMVHDELVRTPEFIPAPHRDSGSRCPL